MKRAFVCITLLLAALLCLSGCYPLEPMYEQEDADRITGKGAGMMQAWLHENMPDAVLKECTADIVMWREDGNDYLTGYACGWIEENEETTRFSIDTVTGDVYFDMDADTLDALRRATATYLYESMGVTEEYDGNYFSCSVMAPVHDSEQFENLDYGLPAGVEDLDAFVRNPGSRPRIHIGQFQFALRDDWDLSLYGLEAMEKLEQECGVYLDYMDILGNGQRVIFDSGKACFYESGRWLQGEGYELQGVVRVREEKREPETNGIVVSDRYFDPEQDLIFEETKNGFRFSFPNEDWEQGFRFYADADSELPHHDYIYYYGDHQSSLSWKERNDGSYVMISKNQSVVDFDLDGRLERIE